MDANRIVTIGMNWVATETLLSIRRHPGFREARPVAPADDSTSPG